MSHFFIPFRAFLLGTTVLFPLIATAQETAELGTITVEGAKGDGTVGYVPRTVPSATKTDLPIEKTAQTVNVVTRQQIDDQAPASVAQALRYEPGIMTEYRGAENLHDETIVRGFGYVPVYLDGLTFNDNGQIDPWLLERIDLVKGPSSVLYGQANPGGLINMTTRKANGERIREVQTSTGSGDRAGLAFDLGDKLSDTVDWRIAGTGWRVDTQEDGQKQQRYSFAPSLRWTPTDATTITVLAIAQNEPNAGFRNFREAAGTVWDTAVGRKIPADFMVSDPNYDRSTRNTKALETEVEHRLDADTVLRAKARVARVDTDFRTLVWGALEADGKTISRLASGGTDDITQQQLDLSLEHKLRTGAAEHTFLIGIDTRYSRRDYEWGQNRTDVPAIDWTDPVYGYSYFPLTQNADTTTNARQTGIYAQDVIALDRWTLSGGLRYDDFSVKVKDRMAGETNRFDDQATTGRLGALYTFDNGIAPYISYSTSFEPVTESSGTSTPFDPTKARQYEAGVKWASTDGRWFAQAAVFDLRQTGVLDYDYTAQAYRQIGRIDSRGLELEGRGNFDNGISVIASASWINAEVKDSTDASEVGQMPARIPRMTAALWTKYTAPSGFDVGFGVRHIGKSEGNGANTFEVSPVTLYDLSFGYDFGQLSSAYEGLRGQINIQNLTDKYYTASCASQWACFIGSERTVVATLDYKF